MKINFTGTIFANENLTNGILALSADYDFTPLFGEEADITLTASHGEANKLRVKLENNSAEIIFDKKIHFFRGLGILLLALSEGKTELNITEDVQFDMNGPMFDVSQGSGVINIPTLKRFLRNMAMMGLSMLMLYCEDSFDVDGEPYFGYMRSRYSEKDMRELDDYADMFGIEMIPCIQTLAHLTEVLKWKGIYGDVTDYDACLLVGEERTYEIVRRIIESASKPFRTKRIHIGLDEAWQLGQGQYLVKNGLVPRDEIMRQHLNRVMEIVRDLGLEPMMWGDMFFNAPGTNAYYNDEPVRQEAIDAMPEGMRLIYWDYYHFNSDEFYLDYIDKHRLFCEPIFAGGIWTWEGYAANWTRTFNSTSYALSACKKRKLRDVFATIWGDADTECNVNATLLGLALYAEHGYCPTEPDRDVLRRRFEFICDANYDDFMKMQLLDHISEDEQEQIRYQNPCKILMYQDVLCGLFDIHYEGIPYAEHYTKLAEYYDNARKRGNTMDFLMDMNYNVCYTLALKADMGIRIMAAYKADDRAELKNIMENDLPELKSRVQSLRDSHRIAWFKTYKPLGWETFDARYGATMSRLDSAMIEIGMYLNGELETIAELDEPRLPYKGKVGDTLSVLAYSKIAFSHRIF